MQTSSGQVYGSDRYSLRIGLEHVREVVPTKIQNVVLALSISISVMDIAFEFSFMPGPYHKSSKRDDLMVLLQETLSTANTMQNALSAAASSSMDALNSDLLSLASNPDVAAPPPLSREIAAPRPTRKRPEDISQRNALIRSYLRLNPMQKQVSKLTKGMERMKMSWKLNDDRLDNLMHVRCSKNEDDDLVYHDTVANKDISAKAYELRYRELIKQPPIILHSRVAMPQRHSVVLDSQGLNPTRQFGTGRLRA
ncbi:hypothetical protein DYB32_009594 [Aphanomyces invadans]|uniref:Uncharacterized protein n=1 Tax=Aphanomyces invadans TaxID=157072 RepID=A0A3R6YXJ7_9STRA|nr:hypothetical protein DYB32_009594 [Aphanomyces invadans]